MKWVGYTILFYVAMACGIAHAGQLDITLVSNGGLSMDLGYSDEATFQADAKKVMDYFFSKEPYKSRAQDIRFYAIWNPKPLGCKRSSTTSRLITCNSLTARQVVEAAGIPAEKGLILVNTTNYGGGGGAQFAVSYRGSQMKQVALHEFAHSLAGVSDEYTLYSTSGTPSEAYFQNCWRGASAPDAAWVKGCRHPNWWRQRIQKPDGTWANSVMQGLGYAEFNPISQTLIRQAIDRWVNSP